MGERKGEGGERGGWEGILSRLDLKHRGYRSGHKMGHSAHSRVPPVLTSHQAKK